MKSGLAAVSWQCWQGILPTLHRGYRSERAETEQRDRISVSASQATMAPASNCVLKPSPTMSGRDPNEARAQHGRRAIYYSGWSPGRGITASIIHPRSEIPRCFPFAPRPSTPTIEIRDTLRSARTLPPPAAGNAPARSHPRRQWYARLQRQRMPGGLLPR